MTATGGAVASVLRSRQSARTDGLDYRRRLGGSILAGDRRDDSVGDRVASPKPNRIVAPSAPAGRLGHPCGGGWWRCAAVVC